MEEILTEVLPGMVQLAGGLLVDFIWQAVLIALVYALLRHLLRTSGPAVLAMLGQLAMLAFLVVPLAGLYAAWPGASPIVDAAAAAPASGWESMPVVAAPLQSLQVLLPWLVAVWLTGVVVQTARALMDWVGVRRLCREAFPVDEHWQRTVRQLQHRLGIIRPVRLVQSMHALVPIQVGWLRPVVVLPLGMLTNLPREHVVPLLLHELAHVRRWDFLLNLGQVVVEILFFFHPAVHWVSRRLREDRELACDEFVLRAGADRRDYARALASLAEVVPQPVRGGFAMSAHGGELLNRIARIVERPLPRAKTGAFGAPAWALVVLSFLVATAGLNMVARQSLAQPFAIELRRTIEMVAPLTMLDARLEGLPSRTIAWPDITPRSAPPVSAEPVVAMRPEAAASLARETVSVPALDVSGIDSMAIADAAPVQLQLPAEATPPRNEAADPAPGAGNDLRVLHQVAPAYPFRARLDGQQGRVVLSFQVGADGRPTQVRVQSAHPRGVFERAALDAMRGWRFEPLGPGAMGTRFEQSFDFVVANSAQSAEPCHFSSTGTRLCRPPQ